MDKNKYEIIRLKMERCAEALRRNNIYCECVDNSEEALDVISSLLNNGDTVAVGGSMTLFETGVIDLLRNGSYNFLDRYESGLTPQDIAEIYTKSFSAAKTPKGSAPNTKVNVSKRASPLEQIRFMSEPSFVSFRFLIDSSYHDGQDLSSKMPQIPYFQTQNQPTGSRSPLG